MGKALNISDFRLLLIAGSAKVFSRLWCGFEMSMSMSRSAPFDMAVCPPKSKAHIMTHGLTDADEEMEKRHAGNGIVAKTTREAGFPLAIGAMGMEIAIETADSSNEEDRARILNCIAGQSPDSEPLAKHPLYTQTNKRLHAYFA